MSTNKQTKIHIVKPTSRRCQQTTILENQLSTTKQENCQLLQPKHRWWWSEEERRDGGSGDREDCVDTKDSDAYGGGSILIASIFAIIVVVSITMFITIIVIMIVFVIIMVIITIIVSIIMVIDRW